MIFIGNLLMTTGRKIIKIGEKIDWMGLLIFARFFTPELDEK